MNKLVLGSWNNLFVILLLLIGTAAKFVFFWKHCASKAFAVGSSLICSQILCSGRLLFFYSCPHICIRRSIEVSGVGSSCKRCSALTSFTNLVVIYNFGHRIGKSAEYHNCQHTVALHCHNSVGLLKATEEFWQRGGSKSFRGFQSAFVYLLHSVFSVSIHTTANA